MKKNNPEYWEKRIAQKVWGTYNSIEERNIRLLEMYQDAAKDISNELYALGQKLGKDGVLSRSDMYKHNRLIEMKCKIEKTIENLGQKVESFTKTNMKEGYQDSYRTVMEQLYEVDYSMPNKKAMEEMFDRPWHGSNFSDRLWNNTESLASTLNDSLVRGIEQGKTTTEMAIEVSNAMQSGFNVTHRLVRTETIHYLNQAALNGYKDSGVRNVQYWAAEDERTCDECGDTGYHGRIFDINKAPILPIHPNCRCTYLPIVEDELQKQSGNDTLEETTDQWAKEAKAELLKEEKYLSAREKETTLVYDGQGALVFRKHGTESEIKFTVAEFMKLKGNVVTHNHPSGGSFSVQDIVTLKNSRAAEIRAATENGVYHMRPPENWPKELKRSSKLMEIQDEIRREVRKKYRQQYLDGKITKIERYQQWSDESNRIFAERYGFDYGKEEF